MAEEAGRREFRVFFSWQSDLPKETTTQPIRAALRDAASRLEAEHAGEGLHVVLDEATRGQAGSPNIPLAVFAKLSAADAVVCDLTTINADRPDGSRAVPNPNVAIELGYAIAEAGWGRIIMLFNTAFGVFPDDLPFDVDRHRASRFAFDSAPPGGGGTLEKIKANRVKAQAALADLLTTALKAIWQNQPPRPAEMRSIPPERLRRDRDVVALRGLLSTLHLPTLDRFTNELPLGHFPADTLHYWENFHAAFTSPLFHLHDGAARERTAALHNQWDCCLSLGQHFHPNSGTTQYIFRNPGDLPFDEQQQRDWDRMQAHCEAMRPALDGLLAHVREEYVEIDLEAASETARRDFIRFHAEPAAETDRDP